MKGKMKAKAYLSLIVCLIHTCNTHNAEEHLMRLGIHLPQMWPTYTDTYIFYPMKDLFHTHTYMHGTYSVQMCRGTILYTN